MGKMRKSLFCSLHPTKPIMTWNRAYHYYLIFGDTTPEYVPWETQVWKAKKTVYRSRGWEQCQQSEHWDLVNSIQDTMSVNICKGPVANLQKMVFEEIPFEPFWDVVYER